MSLYKQNFIKKKTLKIIIESTCILKTSRFEYDVKEIILEFKVFLLICDTYFFSSMISLTRANAFKKSSNEHSDTQTYVYEVPAAILPLSFHIRQIVQIRLKGIYIYICVYARRLSPSP